MLLVIQGKVDDWRLQRRAAWKIAESFRGTSEMPEIYNFYPLPYDDELIDQEKEQQQTSYDEYYHRWALEQLQAIKWPARPSKN